MSKEPRFTKLPPGEALGARDLHDWALGRAGGRASERYKSWRASRKKKADRKKKRGQKKQEPAPIFAPPAQRPLAPYRSAYAKTTKYCRVEIEGAGTFAVFVFDEKKRGGFSTTGDAWAWADRNGLS